MLYAKKNNTDAAGPLVLNQNSFYRFGAAALAILFLLGFLIRIKALWAPIAGDFSSYQIDNLCISKFMLQEGWPGVLYPKTMTLFNGKPLLILLSFPLASVTASAFNHVFGGDIAFWGHFQGFLYSLAGVWIYFRSLKSIAGKWTASLTCVILWLSPLFMIYGSKFFAEASAFFFLILAVHFALKSLESKTANPVLWFFCGTALGIMFVLRVHFILTLPAFLYLLWLERSKGSWLRTLIFFFLPLGIPFFVWSFHVSQAAKEGMNVTVNFYMQSQFRDRLADWTSSINLVRTPHFQKVILNDFHLSARDWFVFGRACFYLSAARSKRHSQGE